VHDSLDACLRALAAPRVFAFSTRASRRHDEVAFEAGDALLFGPESRGLPMEILHTVAEDRRLRLPMRPGQRSLNLSNAVAVAVFEAWRQHGFAGAQ
jgi:tRNA (cytidine/uridine-2'-O-)-methyltransferase